MRLFRLFAISLVAVGALCAASTPSEALLVLSKRDHTLAIVDPASLAVVARMPVGEDPHEVIASADGRLAYVSNYGSGAFHTLALLDLVAQKALPSIDLGALTGPHGLTVWGGKTFFTAEGAKAIGSYDPAQKKVDWILGTGQNRTHMVYVLSDGKTIVTSNVASATVSIIEKVTRQMMPPGPPPGGQGPGGQPPGGPPPGGPHGPPRGAPGGDWNETVIPVGRGAEGFDISPDRRQIWVANAQDGTVSIIDFAAKKVVETLPANWRGANRLKFTLDGKLAFISSLGGSASLSVVDTATHREVKRIDLGGGSAGIEMDPNGRRAYVACTGRNYVAVVDLQKLEVTGKIDAGPEPDGMAWAVRH